MFSLFEKIFKIKKIHKLTLSFWVMLDNLCYKVISRLAIFGNDGIHPKHKIMDYHKFFTDNIDTNDIILDVGCGSGENAYDIAKKANTVVAIDVAKSKIDKARELHSCKNIEYIVGDATSYNFGRKFDKAVLSNVLEHIEERVDFLRKLRQNSNIILLRVPLLDRGWLVLYKKEKGLEYRLDPTHFVEYTLCTLRKELTESGWLIKDYSIQFGEFWGVLVLI